MTKPVYEKHHDESASKIGQYVYDHLPREHDAIDIDHVVFKKSRRCLRMIEEKLPGERLKPSQERVLTTFARMIRLAIENDLLSGDSGVFVLSWWAEPHDTPVRVDEENNLLNPMKVQRVSDHKIEEHRDIKPSQVRHLVSGMPVSDE